MVDIRYQPKLFTPKFPAQIRSIPQEMQKLVMAAYKIDEKSSCVTPDLARWALSRIDHTRLPVTRLPEDDDKMWMERMAREAKTPFPVTGVCTWGDRGKIGHLVCNLANAPHINIAAVSNYPHGDLSPEKAAENISKIRAYMGSPMNQTEIDNVIDYRAWLKGDEALVREKLIAEREACTANGFVMKTIQKANVHALSKRITPYDSLYRSSYLSLEIGADCVKTCTGMAAAPPFSDDVAKDATIPEIMVPMFAALRDFNKANGTQRFAKVSGGQESEIDAARIAFLATEILGEDSLNTIVVGASHLFRRRLMQYLDESDPAHPVPRAAFGPQARYAAALPPHLRGLP
jgi:deoxyribose-phosphate aldolase